MEHENVFMMPLGGRVKNANLQSIVVDRARIDDLRKQHAAANATQT
jgi:hypothetical protein